MRSRGTRSPGPDSSSASTPWPPALAHDQLSRLDAYLAGREEIAAYLIRELGEIPGLEVSSMPEGVKSSWYALTATYRPDQLGGLPVDRFHAALVADGATESDRPGSTRPLNQLPLYQHPSPLFPGYPNTRSRYREGDFPIAEKAHTHDQVARLAP
ncbi:DegT/DnrJ/EryC1/StrS family aminotransferase [Streptomyces decoyicus]|uniref:DegT/DnrJ/EryC1/StrS family aminotransferase n=1 Tax=Streptomyces decoyicus TaxID=249567 RepID=UPI00363C7370